MCGIFAAINSSSVSEHLIHGLSQLTYRGYDSAGIAILNQGKIERRRASGKLQALTDTLKISPVNGNIGIAHTRWATHGLPTENNAHPHMTKRVAVVHNGIVENYQTLRQKLERSGYVFESETDSETIAQLITYYLDQGFSKEKSLCKALSEVKGSFGIVIIFSQDLNTLYAARKGSPLVLGKSKSGFYVSSDMTAFDSDVTSMTHLKDGDIAKLSQDSFEVFNSDGQKLNRLLQKFDQEQQIQDKQGFRHYMLKEIHEQKEVYERTLHHYFNSKSRKFQLPRFPVEIKNIQRISLIACGTSYFAASVGKYWIEQLTRIPVDLDIASEYRYRNPPIAKDTLAVFISQSGETADTLAALNYTKALNIPSISLVNVLTSTMANESNAVLPTIAGPEIGVASTKAFLSQLTTLLIMSLAIKQEREEVSVDEAQLQKMLKFPKIIQDFLSNTNELNRVAKKLQHSKHALYLGRGIAYPLAEEGALKLKEISYIHAEAYPAGELKHGPLALVDEDMPIVFIAPPGELVEKSLSNLREVASRGGRIILIGNKFGIEQAKEYIDDSIEMPEVDELLMPLIYTLPLQLIAYYVALAKGNDVDQPRNLAKSVTVE